jgi:hypothetical protein
VSAIGELKDEAWSSFSSKGASEAPSPEYILVACQKRVHPGCIGHLNNLEQEQLLQQFTMLN